MDSGSIAWVLASAALVLFMTPGLAFFYGGMDQRRNVLNMLMMNFYCLLMVPLVWFAVGYTLSYSGQGSVIGNFDLAFLRDLNITGEDGGATLLSVAYLGMFAVITPALISGAVADRMKFSAWAIFVPAWIILVYCPIGFWVYGGYWTDGVITGWLGERGSLDFAGGTVIHVNAGIAALAAVLVLGKRRLWPRDVEPPHSMPLVMIGTGILWFGWFGFNAGSAFAANGQAIQAFLNTFLAAAAAGLVWVVVEWIRDGKPTNLGAASGIVAGLVAITPGAGFVAGASPIAIGAIAGLVCCYAVKVKFKAGFDDALDVVGVHFVGGLVGSLLIGFFADPSFFGLEFKEGLFLGGGLGLLGEQLLANLAAIIWSFALTFGIMFVLKKTIGVRVGHEEEVAGLDLAEHAETAYHGAT